MIKLPFHTENYLAYLLIKIFKAIYHCMFIQEILVETIKIPDIHRPDYA